MNSSLLWVLFAIIMISYVIPFVVTLFALLRQTIFQLKTSRLDAIPPLSELHQAAVDELAALGFTPFVAFTMQEGMDKFEGIMLRHETLPTFADIYFRVNPLTAYPVIFYSFTEDGAALVTTNRQPTILEYPGTHQSDSFAETLAHHWQAHKGRMQKAKLLELDNETAYARIAKFYEEYFPYYVQKKIFINRSGNWFMSFPTALKLTSNVIASRKSLRKPYLTVLTSEQYQSAYYAERYQTLENLKKRSKYRPDIAVVSLVISLILSFALLTWFKGWQPAVAIIAVLLVHEFGHAIAMYIFGYRDMKMFFVPFLGAFVSGNAKNICVWKQSIILLAGPLPGLLFGFWALYYAHHNPGSDFLLQLSYIAIGINFFNLLPLSFLDGGRLLEIAFFTRWPYAAFAFSLLSCFGMSAFVVWSNNYNLLIIALLMALSLKSAWRIAYFRSTWKGQREDTSELPKLFGLVRQKFGNLPFPRQYSVVKAVYDPPHVKPPRVWETLLTLSLFILIWSPVLLLVWHKWSGMTHSH